MAKDLFARYVWIVDTIRRYGTITRRQLDECWLNSRFSDGNPLPRRTFFNYRQAIEELFQLEISFDPRTNSYSIIEDDTHQAFVTDWMLNSASMTHLLSDARDVASLIFLEDVPSARSFLPLAVAALREKHPMIFNYHPYTRATPNQGITIDPYFLKIFRQRWYVTGRNHADGAIKTYALDRMSAVNLSPQTYTIPDDFDAETYFHDSFGIIFNHSEVKDIVIKVDARQAKYFRALPLHHSQHEEISDSYSIFTYRLKISDDFVSELLSYGPRITVLRPPELRAIITRQLSEALNNYQ